MLTGSMVALVTPMHLDGMVDWQQLERLIEWHIAQGTDAIVSVGTTGESATLTFDEHKSVIRFTVDIVNKRLPVIAGAGANSTREAIELTNSAYQSGCNATLQVTPYYNKPPQRGLFQHFEQIARAVPLPVILYNVPSRTACEILPETTLALSKISNIIGTKEATDILHLRKLRKLIPFESDFKIFSGEDGICAEAACEGLINGVISVTANVAPKLMHDMITAGLKGQRDSCLRINEQLSLVHEAMFVETNPLPVKYALNKMGKIGEGIRMPLVPLNSAYRKEIDSALSTAGLL